MLSNPYYDREIDLTQDDVFTLAGVTVCGPGVGKAARKKMAEIVNDILHEHGPHAFELPKRAAAIHEAGHVVINSVLGLTTTSVFIDYIQRGEKLHWIGMTNCPELAIVDTPDDPASFDKLLTKARTIYAGIAAEDIFAGDDHRAGSSLDEVFMSQFFTRDAAERINTEPEPLWRNEVWAWCLCQLKHNRHAHAEITEALLERKRIKGKLLRDLCAKVSALPLTTVTP